MFREDNNNNNNRRDLKKKNWNLSFSSWLIEHYVKHNWYTGESSNQCLCQFYGFNYITVLTLYDNFKHTPFTS